MKTSRTLLFIFLSVQLMAQSDPQAVIGRWNITIDMNGIERPASLEVVKSGFETLIGYIMVIGGSPRPISEIRVDGDKYTFTIPPQWDRGDDQSFEFSSDNGMLKGTMRHSNGKTYQWNATRAPRLTRDREPQWDQHKHLFNGKDLTGWTVPKDERGRENQWKVVDGVLTSPKGGVNLMTEEVFDDFKLHVEFRYPKNGNSGVYLRGRYEVQISDGKGLDPDKYHFGGVYGRIAPNEMVAKDAGEWQSMDVTLIGRMITVEMNGTMVICNQEITGITGGAIDNREEEPGPILFQGDHEPVEFRNIVITPGK